MNYFRKLIFIVLTIFMIISSNISVFATTTTPNVMCNEFGCLISSNVVRLVKPFVQYYSQTDSRWTTTAMKRANGSSCGTIGALGCALTSFSMIVATYGNSDTLYTPKLVNDYLTQSCSFDPSGWSSKYSAIVRNGGSQTIPIGYQSDILYLRRNIAQLIEDGYIVIVYGYDSTTKGYHYMVAYGYNGLVDLYDTGVHHVTSATEIYINDPGYSARKELADYMAKFESVYNIYYFKKV